MDEKWFVLVQVGAPHHFDKMFFSLEALFLQQQICIRQDTSLPNISAKNCGK
jgi:hypothetical protein